MNCQHCQYCNDEADELLQYSTNDFAWMLSFVDGDNGEAKAVYSMLLAYASSPDTMLTPAEIAERTATAESTWRNKAAAGQLPGATKKGKQWLIPLSTLRVRGIIEE